MTQEALLAYAHILKALTDLSAFEDYRFMPVTRDMSQGMRTLLYKYLDGNAIVKVGAMPEGVAGESPLVKLNRSMRQA